MYKNTIKAVSFSRPGDLFPEDKNQFYRRKLKKAGPSVPESVLFPAPPPPDEKTIERLNILARQAPFCTYHKYKKNNIL